MNSCVFDARMDIPKTLLEQLYCKQKLSSKIIARQLSCDATTICNYLRQYDLPIRHLKESHRFQVFTKFPGRILHPKRDFNGSPPQKAYLIGFRLGDLYVTKVSNGPYCQTIQINCRTTKLAQVRLFRKLFRGYGYLYECKPDKNGAFGLTYYVNRSFDFLLPKQDSVETWIQADFACSAAFAAGYIDAEGSFHLVERKSGLLKSVFALASQDRNILAWFHNWFMSQQILCAAPKLAIPKNTPRQFRLNKDYWILQVHRKDALLQLSKLLSHWIQHPKRRYDLARVLRNIKERNRSPNLKFASRQHRLSVHQTRR